jgi:uncharacterized protein YbjT (DUF2867 family)
MLHNCTYWSAASYLWPQVIAHHIKAPLHQVYTAGGPGRWWQAHAQQLARYTESRAQAAARELEPGVAAKMWEALGLAKVTRS